VGAGWGWSHGKNECGAYLNTNCDADSSEAADDDEEEDEDDDVEFTTSQQEQQRQEEIRIPDPAPIPAEPLGWANTEQTTLLWQLVHAGDINSLKSLLYREPTYVHHRAEDGRGPLFWAYEYQKSEIIDFLLERGADPDALDVNNQKPAELSQNRDEL